MKYNAQVNSKSDVLLTPLLSKSNRIPSTQSALGWGYGIICVYITNSTAVELLLSRGWYCQELFFDQPTADATCHLFRGAPQLSHSTQTILLDLTRHRS